MQAMDRTVRPHSAFARENLREPASGAAQTHRDIEADDAKEQDVADGKEADRRRRDDGWVPGCVRAPTPPSSSRK